MDDGRLSLRSEVRLRYAVRCCRADLDFAACVHDLAETDSLSVIPDREFLRDHGHARVRGAGKLCDRVGIKEERALLRGCPFSEPYRRCGVEPGFVDPAVCVSRIVGIGLPCVRAQERCRIDLAVRVRYDDMALTCRIGRDEPRDARKLFAVLIYLSEGDVAADGLFLNGGGGIAFRNDLRDILRRDLLDCEDRIRRELVSRGRLGLDNCNGAERDFFIAHVFIKCIALFIQNAFIDQQLRSVFSVSFNRLHSPCPCCGTGECIFCAVVVVVADLELRSGEGRTAGSLAASLCVFLVDLNSYRIHVRLIEDFEGLVFICRYGDTVLFCIELVPLACRCLDDIVVACRDVRDLVGRSVRVHRERSDEGIRFRIMQLVSRSLEGVARIVFHALFAAGDRSFLQGEAAVLGLISRKESDRLRVRRGREDVASEIFRRIRESEDL